MRPQRGLMRFRSCSVVSYRVLKTVQVEGCCGFAVVVVVAAVYKQQSVLVSKGLAPRVGGKAKS